MFSYLVLSGEASKVEEIFTKINNLVNDKKSAVKSRFSDIFFVNTQFVISNMSSQRLWAYFAFSDNKKDLEMFVEQNNHGLCIVNSNNKNIKADDCLDWLNLHNIDEASREFDEEFSCVSITNKNGFSAFSCFSGGVPVFYSSKLGVNLISNVSKLISYIVNDSFSYDYLSLSWMITSGNIFFDKTLFCNVNKLNSQKYIKAEIGRSFGFSLVPYKDSIFTKDSNLCSDLTNDEWDYIFNKLVKRIECYVNRMPNKRFLISGDKDSRLLLALALSSSYKNEIEVFSDSTNHDYLADFCSSVGINRFTTSADLNSNKRNFDNSSDLLKLCLHFMRTFNQRSSLLSERDNFTLSSFGGGLYRGIWWNQYFSDKDFDNVSNKPYMKFINYSQSFDKYQMLSDYSRLAQIEQVSSWVTDNYHEYQNNLQPEKFYFQNIIGNSCYINPLNGESSGFPLLSFDVAKLYFKLSLSARSRELLHFNCMYRSNPKLCEYPFIADSWKPEMNGYKGLNCKSIDLKIESHQMTFLKKFLIDRKEQAKQILDDARRHTDIERLVQINKVKNQLDVMTNNSQQEDIFLIFRTIATCLMLSSDVNLDMS